MRLDDALSKSPMKKFLTDFDNAHLHWTYNEYWRYAMAQDFRVWNALLVKEITFRKDKGLNFIWSIEGEQGDGKSMGLTRIKQIIDEHNEVKFKLKSFLSKLHFFHEDLEESLSTPGRRTCDVLDEQTKMHGLMVRFIEDQLANFEDIYRKPQRSIGYASPSLRRHEHFFIFEALGDIYVNKEGEPSAVALLLKTKRKSDKMIMPRGIIKLKTPEPELWEAYNKKKDKFIEKMQSKQGGVMARIEKDADKVIKKAGDSLYRYLKDGTKLPAAKKTIDLYMYKILGMRSYTVAGYELVREEIKRKL